MSNPLVTIIIPVYNCQRYIRKCLETVIGQTYKNIEIVIVNDGSNDGSEKIILKFCQKMDGIILLKQNNQGVSIARNRGVELAKGKYITFIDGDDYVAQDYIENFVKCAEKYQSELCVCGYTKVTIDGQELFKVIPTEYKSLEKEEFAYRMLAVCGRFYALELWRRLKISYETTKKIRGEDIPVALLTNALARNIQSVHQTGYYYVQHGSSARNNMRGLENYKLPYQALENCISYVMKSDETNSKEFFELGVFRVFTTFLFDLGRGSNSQNFYELYQYIQTIVRMYFIHYEKNEKMYIFSDYRIPLLQKIEVKIFLLLQKIKLLYLIGNMVRRIK